MLLCYVNVGDSVSQPPQQLNSPPKRPDGKNYDSVNGIDGSAFIIYNSN